MITETEIQLKHHQRLDKIYKGRGKGDFNANQHYFYPCVIWG